MGRTLRHAPVFALVTLALAGCGGNNATQPTNVSSSLTLASVFPYPSDTATVSGSTTVRPLALFRSAGSSEELLVWGTRDANGNVTGVTESAITSTDTSSQLAKSPVYALYGSDGGLVSLEDSQSSAYLTLASLSKFTDPDTGAQDDAIRYKGVSSTGATSSGTVYLKADGGVAVSQDGKATQIFSAAKLGAILAHSKDVVADPLAGLTTVDANDPAARVTILSNVFKVAAVLVDSDFKSLIADTEGFVQLDKLGASYTAYVQVHGVPTVDTTLSTLPANLTYRSDLPTP